MKNFSILLIFLLFLAHLYYPVFAEDELIWRLQEDNFLENITSDKSPITEEKKVFLEGEIKKYLDTDVVYANLADCILTAAQNSYDLKINYQLSFTTFEIKLFMEV